MGAMAVDGVSSWNQEWTSGLLLFDQSISAYPERYGEKYTKDYALFDLWSQDTTLAISDTSITTTQINYTQGDYGLNVFEVSGDFNGDNRYIGLHGFKRTFPGNYAQYLTRDGRLEPSQQSYRVDYGSSKNGLDVNISVGKFITRMGIYDTLAIRRTFADDITSAGIRAGKKIGGTKIQVTMMTTNRNYTINASYLPVKGAHYLNRSHIGLDIVFPSGNHVFVQRDQRLLSKKNDYFTAQRWNTAGVEFNWYKFVLSGGGIVAADGSFGPIAKFGYLSQGKHWINEFVLESTWKPVPVMLENSSLRNRFQRVNNGKVAIGYQDKKSSMGIFTHAVIIDQYRDGLTMIDTTVRQDGNESNISFGLNGATNIFGLDLSIDYLHNLSPNTLNLGFRQHVFFKTSGNIPLFSGNLLAKFIAQVEGVLDRDPHWRMDPFTGIPFRASAKSNTIRDYWVGHLAIEAKVSTFTFIWSVNNVMAATENLWKSTSVKIPVITTNTFLPPMNRLLRFQVIWDFKN